MPYPCCCNENVPGDCATPCATAVPGTITANWTDPCFGGFSKTLSQIGSPPPGSTVWEPDDTSIVPADADCTFGAYLFINLQMAESGGWSSSIQGWKNSFGISGTCISVNCVPFEVVFEYAQTAGVDCCADLPAPGSVMRVTFTE